MKRIKVLLADDHALFRQGLGKIIEEEKNIEIVGEVGEGQEVVEKVRELTPDIILLDIKFAEMNGLVLARKIKRLSPKTKIIILSMYEDEAHILEAIQSGANAYVPKSIDYRELIKTIHTVQSEKVFLPQAITHKVFTGIRKTKLSFLPKPGVELTKREIEILALTARGKTNKEIANNLSISEKTVKNQVNIIFEKCGVKNRVEAVVYAIKKGYVSVE